ncbi:hypothetical protein [Massilia suwonensis]|uniref:hypothetical protein n=1 Tax=Massilia suwonensis TaxID=648895 RepID=UPI0036D2A3A1
MDTNRYQVGLDIYIEAEDSLTLSKLERAATMAGASEVTVEGNELTARFASGLMLWTVDKPGDRRLCAEDTKGLAFSVGRLCHLRIKGPTVGETCPFGEIEQLAKSIAQVCPSSFVISFQFEQTLYWRDRSGLHCREEPTR